MDDQERLDDSGAFAFEPLLRKGSEPPPEEYSNPPGVGRRACDTDEGAEQDAGCDAEVTAQLQDLVLEETKPGFGIDGFEGEEVGGG